jgi:hypothetical protein
MKAKKFKFAVWSAAVLWMVVLIQIVTTRVYVSQTGVTQAFARNSLTVVEKNSDTRDTSEGNTCLEGYVSGRLDTAEMEKLADNLFQSMGGGNRMDNVTSGDGGYYVAYGYTSGLKKFKNVNGHRVNLNVAMQYDETKGCTRVVMGTPLINSDF